MDDEDYDFREHYRLDENIFYVRVLQSVGINEVIEAKIRTLDRRCIVACDSKTKQTVLIGVDLKDRIFKDRKSAAQESHKYKVRVFKNKEIVEEED